MLAPNETIPGIRVADVFACMLADLPWKSFQAYIQANTQLCKQCLIGGYRMEPKHRKRFEMVLLKEAERGGFATSFCNPIFAQWYPVHEALYRRLEDYFHSDGYKAHRQGLGLGEDAYVLPEERFTELFAVEDLEKWRILLFFSPLQFSKEQTEKVMASTGGNESLLKRIRDLEAMVEAARQDNARLTAEGERARSQAEGATAELQELRRLKRDLAAERDTLQGKFDASQADNRRLRQSLAEKGDETQAQIQQASAQMQQDKIRLDGVIAKLEKDAADWRVRYEQQRGEYRELKEQAAQTEAALAQERARLADREKKLQDLAKFADLVLSRMDWAQAGKNLHLPPTMQRQFNSVLKKLNYETETGVPTLDASMAVFWDNLMAIEKTLVDHVAHSDTLEVADGSAAEFWEGLKDDFDDVLIGLEARLMLLKLVREIFYTALDAETLEAPKLPASAFPKAGKS
jgi:hypothetical protein